MINTYEVYIDTDSPYSKKPILICYGKNGIEALKTIFPNFNVKKGLKNDVNCMLTPIYFKNGIKYKHSSKRITWYKLTSNLKCINDRT